MLQILVLLMSCFLEAWCSKSHMEELMGKPFQPIQWNANAEDPLEKDV